MQDEMIRMAREAGFMFNKDHGDYVCFPSHILTFATLVAEATLEKAAKVCEELGALDAMDGEEFANAAMVRVADRQSELCALAIRSMK